MDDTKAREIYKQIMGRAMRISMSTGARNMIPGSVMQASREMWLVEGKPGEFDQWRREVLAIARNRAPRNGKLRVNAEAKSLVSGKSEGPSIAHQHDLVSKRNNGKGAFLDRYRIVAMKHDKMPADDFLSEEWGCDIDTPGRMRSKLARDGFVFKKRDGVWRVIDRPKPVEVPTPASESDIPQVVETETPQEIKQLELQPAGEILVSHPDPMLSNLLLVMRASLQMQAETYRRLGDIESLLSKLLDAWTS